MLKKLDNQLYQKLLSDADKSPRKRSHYNLHENLDDPVQRLCVALKKGTYIRPHHHPQQNKWELILVLQGSIGLIIFDKTGKVLERNTLNKDENRHGVELKSNTWHMILPLSNDAIMLEIKEGPYTPFTEADFASWAPAETDANVDDFLHWVEQAQTGERYASAL